MVHFNWTQLIPGVGHEYVHVATAGVASTVLIALALRARLALGSGENSSTPTDRLSVRAVFESITEMFANLADTVIGHDGKKYVPMFSSIFLFVIVNNLIGLVPGMTAATDNPNTTFALGLFTFIAYNFFGFKESGLAYLKHFAGPIVFLAPLMFVLEMISHLVRPMSLGLRLMGNIQGDHAVLGAFLDLAPIGVPVLFYFMGLFVAFMQAFIFTLLSMVYVSMAVEHDH